MGRRPAESGSSLFFGQLPYEPFDGAAVEGDGFVVEEGPAHELDSVFGVEQEGVQGLLVGQVVEGGEAVGWVDEDGDVLAEQAHVAIDRGRVAGGDDHGGHHLRPGRSALVDILVESVPGHQVAHAAGGAIDRVDVADNR